MTSLLSVRFSKNEQNHLVTAVGYVPVFCVDFPRTRAFFVPIQAENGELVLVLAMLHHPPTHISYDLRSVYSIPIINRFLPVSHFHRQTYFIKKQLTINKKQNK